MEKEKYFETLVENTAAVQNKINFLIIEFLGDVANWKNGEINWSFIDADLWCDPRGKQFSDMEKIAGLEFFPTNCIPACPE